LDEEQRAGWKERWEMKSGRKKERENRDMMLACSSGSKQVTQLP
jgi:hypothetical protein